MLEKIPHPNDGLSSGPQLRQALDQIGQIVLDGLRHGHFRCAISSAIGKNNKRDLVIEAGKGVTKKWGEARVWRKWAESELKELPVLRERCPPTLFPLLSSAMASDPAKRPSLETVEQYLWQALEGLDSRFAEGIRLQVGWHESLYQSESWPYFEERLDLLRRFYAQRN